MTKRALFALAGVLGLCFSASAQQTYRPEQFPFDGSTLDRSSLWFPSLSFEDRDQFFFSTAFGSLRPAADYLPAFNPVEPQSIAFQNVHGRGNPVDDVMDLRAPDPIQFGGEVGFLYGKSSGKYGREDFQSYIVGTVGNEKFSITAGYLHQESTINIPRRRR